MKKMINVFYFFVVSVVLGSVLLACSPDTDYDVKRSPTLIVADENFLSCIE